MLWTVSQFTQKCLEFLFIQLLRVLYYGLKLLPLTYPMIEKGLREVFLLDSRVEEKFVKGANLRQLLHRPYLLLTDLFELKWDSRLSGMCSLCLLNSLYVLQSFLVGKLLARRLPSLNRLTLSLSLLKLLTKFRVLVIESARYVVHLWTNSESIQGFHRYSLCQNRLRSHMLLTFELILSLLFLLKQGSPLSFVLNIFLVKEAHREADNYWRDFKVILE